MNKIILIFVVCFFSIQVSLYSKNPQRPPITPKWALEHIVWEDSVNNQVYSEKLVNLYLEHKMPVGAIIIDSPWSTAYNDFNWNAARYPNSTRMIQNLNKRNVKVILWLTGCINSTATDMPVQKHPLFDEVVANKYAVNNGKTSHWWKGDGLHLDFTNPEAVKWWNKQLDKVVIDGVYGFKVDQGEVYFGDTVQTSVGTLTNVDFRPYYYNSMYKYITDRKATGVILGRPFSHQGGVEASIEQLSLGWCGDFEGSWKGLKLQINNIYKSAELGYGAPGCEVGGFFRARSGKNELIRYAQFGALTACMINGGENGAFSNHLPWYHDKETASCYLQAVWLHSQLIPYLFSTIVDVHKSGGSLIKDFSYEQESHKIGECIYTKAITSKNNSVSFSLPQDGNWMDFWTKEILNGGDVISKTYPLNQFPLYIKVGAIIPMNISNNYSGVGDSTLAGKQAVYIVPGKSKSEYLYNRPLGEGVEYDSVKIAYDGQLNELKVKGETEVPYVFIIPKCKNPIKVTNADSWKYNDQKQELWILKKGKDFAVKLMFR